jgi:hypothetical protein
MKSVDRNTVNIARNAQRTSIAAATNALPRTGTIRRKVYEYFLLKGLRGATDQEVEIALQISGNTLRPTRGSLVKDGYLIDTGTTRKNYNEQDCIVWRAVEGDMLL